jgi:MATE family multidrug resistance protein
MTTIRPDLNTATPVAETHLLDELGPLTRLAIPLVAGLTGMTLIGAIDSWVLGPLGEVPLAAASLTQSVIIIAYAALYGFLGPVGLLVGRAHGAGDPTAIGVVLRHGVVLALAGGLAGAVLFAAVLPMLPWAGQPPRVIAVIGPYWLAMAILLVPYAILLVGKQVLDSSERPWLGAAFLLVPPLVHAPLSFLLVHGVGGVTGLGLLGAGLSCVFAYSVCAALLFTYFARARATAPYRAPWHLQRTAFRTQLAEGLPMGLQYTLEAGAFAIAGMAIGWLGATALAANQIVFSITVLLYMAPLGLAGAVAIRIAQAIGGGEAARVRVIGLAGIATVALWMTATTLILVLFGRRIASTFVTDEAIIALATATFVVVGFMQIADGVQTVSLGALRGALDNAWPTRVSLLAYWGIALPAALIAGFWLDFGIVGVWGGFGAGLTLAAILLTQRFLIVARRTVAQ